MSSILYGTPLASGVIIWTTVGIWRSATRSIERRRTEEKAPGWAGLAKLTVVLIGLAFVLDGIRTPIVLEVSIGLLIICTVLIVSVADWRKEKVLRLGGDFASVEAGVTKDQRRRSIFPDSGRVHGVI